MGFTNVAWESRSTEQLARDLTEGPGPMPVGQAGAAWVRVANELAAISADYLALADRIDGAYQGGSADAVVRRVGDFGLWLQAMSLSAAGNGQRAEEAAVAHGVAIMAMPTVSEAVEVRTERDVMASLAAYNGAILTGRFAELDDAATTGQADAAAVMYAYEDACAGLATPWDQPVPPDVANGAALKAEREAKDAAASSEHAGGGSGGAAVMPPAPLGAFRRSEVTATAQGKPVAAVSSASLSAGGGGGMGGMGGGYGPMAAGMARSDSSREHESGQTSESLEGAGEPGAGLSDAGAAWLPTTGQSDTPLMVSSVSWGPGTSVLDELAVPEPEAPSYAEGPPATLERVSDRWVSPAVIDRDAETAQ